jgi:hypothetical protein
VFTQERPPAAEVHICVPAAHIAVVVQVPATQSWPAPQMLPHLPQFREFVLKSSHVVPAAVVQAVVPGRQLQTPLPLQYWVLVQAAGVPPVPHPPHVRGSSSVSVQTPPKPPPPPQTVALVVVEPMTGQAHADEVQEP